MTIADLLKLKPEEIADACRGIETGAYALLRSATSVLRARVEERIAADRLALGGDPDAPATEPAKRTRATKPRPTLAPNVDEKALRELLLAELDKAPASVLALSRRTGVTKERVHTNLTFAANSAPPLVALYGLKWALVRS